MEDVASRLRQVKDWTVVASTSSLDKEASGIVRKLSKKLQSKAQKEAKLQKDAADRDRVRLVVQQALTDFIRESLEKTAKDIGQSSDIKVSVSQEALAEKLRFGQSFYVELTTTRLSIETKRSIWSLCLVLYQDRTPIRRPTLPEVSAENTFYTIWPFLVVGYPSGGPRTVYFLVDNDARHVVERYDTLSLLLNYSKPGDKFDFQLTSWPVNNPQLSKFIKASVKGFLRYVHSRSERDL
jgi:hypothetical protein